MSAHQLLGRRIRELRRAKGLSQEAFADLCGLHRTYVGSIERGERNVAIDNIEKITLALSTTISQLTDFATLAQISGDGGMSTRRGRSPGRSPRRVTERVRSPARRR